MKSILITLFLVANFSTHLSADTDQFPNIFVSAIKTYESKGEYYRARVAVMTDGSLDINLEKFYAAIPQPPPPVDEGGNTIGTSPLIGFGEYARIDAPLLADEYDYMITRYEALINADQDIDPTIQRCMVVRPRIDEGDYLSVVRGDGTQVDIFRPCYNGDEVDYVDPANYVLADELFAEIMRITDKVTASARANVVSRD